MRSSKGTANLPPPPPALSHRPCRGLSTSFPGAGQAQKGPA